MECLPLLRSQISFSISKSGQLMSASVAASSVLGIGSEISRPSGRIGLGIPP